ncbi:uncharacterized protein LOC142559569 [Dermacentor variabilis]|uniref:uncharacterized protein LOC142559569 n=1 Tax=Dermacentor variabilis TaxID=34621 RepID=UPI003F5B631F
MEPLRAAGAADEMSPITSSRVLTGSGDYGEDVLATDLERHSLDQEQLGAGPPNSRRPRLERFSSNVRSRTCVRAATFIVTTTRQSTPLLEIATDASLLTHTKIKRLKTALAARPEEDDDGGV